jgi:membrane-associated phospholipid phosphatase
MSRRYALRLRRPPFRGIRTPVVTRTQSAGRLVVLGVGAALLVVPLWSGTTQTVTGQQVADLVLYGRGSADLTALGAANQILASVSYAFVAIAALWLTTFALASGGIGLATAVIVLLGGAILTALGLKTALERPDLIGDVAYATGNSFPSGTVTIAASLGLACVLVAPRRIRTLVAMAAGALVALVGMSAIAAGWHRLADVGGGILISLAWASLVTAALVRLQGWMPRRTWGRGLGGRATTAVGVVGAVAVMGGALGMVLVAVDRSTLAERLAARAAAPGPFVAALAIAAGTSLLACAAYVWAMRGVAVESPG